MFDIFLCIWYIIFMKKDMFTINKNGLSYGRGYVYSLQYHLVWCTKYRKKVLKDGIDVECKEMLESLAQEYKFQILAMEVMPDHIHLLVDCRPQFYISDMIKIMKGNLARQMFLLYPELKKELWGGHLWNPSYCAVIVLLLGTFQIQTYLMNVNAPRYLFFYYGGKTANTYFPLGSGFATFGSDQAARNYSRLYYQYGFNSLFGMNTEDGSFLSDTFWPMAIGQFGWIGSILYILIYVRIFFSFKLMKLNSEQKAFLYAGYMQYIIHAIGSAILSASAGMIGAIALAAVMNVMDKPQDKKNDTQANRI